MERILAPQDQPTERDPRVVIEFRVGGVGRAGRWAGGPTSSLEPSMISALLYAGAFAFVLDRVDAGSGEIDVAC